MLNTTKKNINKNKNKVLEDLPLSIEIDENLSCVYFQAATQLKVKEKPQSAIETMLRNIYSEMVSMGIRPVFQLNSVRFSVPGNRHEDKLFINTLKGIGNWSYALDIPVATSDIYFSNIYSGNPIIIIIVCGIIESNSRFVNSNINDGQNLLIVSPPDVNKKYSSIDYKDKLIMESIMKCINNDLVSGIWNTGNKGLMNRLKNLSDKFNIGFKINYNKNIDFDDTNNKLSLLNNKQIIIADKKNLKFVKELFNLYDIEIINIGEVIKDTNILIEDKQSKLHKINFTANKVQSKDEKASIRSKKTSISHIGKEYNFDKLIEKTDYKTSAFKLLSNFNICSKNWIYKQFDAMLGKPQIFSAADTDATLINITKEGTSFFVSLEGNPQYLKYSAYNSAAITISEAARKIICSGGIPSAITYNKDFINYASMNFKPDDFEEALLSAAQSLGLTAVNIKNDFSYILGKKIKPSFAIEPAICVTGILPDKKNLLTMSFKQKGDLIYLIGENKNDISSSQYVICEYGIQNSPAPAFDALTEASLYESIIELNRKKILSSAHSISKGGLFTALAESSFSNKLGFDITTDCEIRTDAFLFGETQGRALVSVSPENETAFIDYLVNAGISFTLLGHVTKGSFRVNDEGFGNVKEAYKIYSQTLETHFNKVL